jgi:hypothetical protein
MSEDPKKVGMTPKELYDYILKHMTAEEALMKLFSYQLETYEHLKENKPFDDETKSVNPVFIIAAAAMDMGWDMCIEKEKNPGDVIRGFVMGTEEYINEVLIDSIDEGQTSVYQKMEGAIIKWSNDGTRTAGSLTREIMKIIGKDDK